MIWLLWVLITLPFRLALGGARVGVKTGYRAGRMLGYRRLTVLAIGVTIGLLLSNDPGRQLREKLRAQLEGSGDGVGGSIDDRVRHELSHSPRTWHLPQPDVEVIGSRVVLRGEVPHETGRADLEAAALAVHGVTHVDNRLTVS